MKDFNWHAISLIQTLPLIIDLKVNALESTSMLLGLMVFLPNFDRKLISGGECCHIHVYWLHIRSSLEKNCQLNQIYLGMLATLAPSRNWKKKKKT